MQNEHAADSPELRHFSSAGVDIAFIDAKPQERDLGEPILLIHGFASNHRINWVNPRWVDTLTKAGRRVVAFDNRGHGQSEKLYAPADYHADLMTRDATLVPGRSRSPLRRLCPMLSRTSKGPTMQWRPAGSTRSPRPISPSTTGRYWRRRSTGL